MGCILNPASTTKVDEGIEIKNIKEGIVVVNQETKKPDQNSLEEEKKTVQNVEKPQQNNFDLDIQWDIFINDQPFRMSVKELTFLCEQCKFFHEGLDDKGRFWIRGQFDINGIVKIELKHELQELSKTFDGKFEDNSIEGNWKDSTNKGKFKLDIVTNIWTADNSSICLRGLSEPFGIGHFSCGWAVLSGTPGNETQANVHIYFADGNTGELECSILDEKVYGRVHLPNKKEEEIYLNKKNEFI